MSDKQEQANLPTRDYFLPTRQAFETLDMGRGQFMICSCFAGDGTIAYHLAKHMLGNVRGRPIENPEQQ